MKSSADELSGSDIALDAAADLAPVLDLLLHVVPRAMSRIRCEMRVAGATALTVPQLRALLFVRRNPGSGLSALAEHVGMAAPSTSALVERLVRAGLVERTTDPDERRRIQLHLTAAGSEHVGRAHLLVRARLARDLATLTPRDLARLADGLEVLSTLTPAGRGGRR